MRLSRARLGFATVLLLLSSRVLGQRGDDPARFIREGFESPSTVWKQEQTDTTVTLQGHDRSNRAAHEGKSSERFEFSAGLGSAFFYSYALPKVPVANDLTASLYVRSNRAGVQLFARVVLPGDTDPDTGAPSFLLVPGTIYDNVERWQRLEVLDLGTSLERQARVLRVSTKRPVSLAGAYIEQLVVNLFTSAGETEVFLDDLSIGPVAAELAAAHAAPTIDAPARPVLQPPTPDEGPETSGSAQVRLDRNRLKRRTEDGLFRDWFFTAIHAPGADVPSLRKAGFDVLIDDVQVDPRRSREAVEKGFLLMPRIGRGGDEAAIDPASVLEAVSKYPFKESVALWDLGDHLGRAADPRARKEELDSIRVIVSRMRSLSSGVSRLTTGIVDDELPRYARVPQNLDVLGIQPSAWGSALGLMDSFQYMKQRRDLTVRGNAGALYWAMLPATPPAVASTSVWGRDAPPPWGAPMIQPEQLRLMTYAALSAGYRGIAYRGDAELTRNAGRMLLLEMSLLNAEIDLCESILANGSDPIAACDAFNPDPVIIPPAAGIRAQRVPKRIEQPPIATVKGAAIGTRDRKTVLVLAADYATNAQFQPSQMALNDMKMTVIVPEGAQAFEVSPGRVRVLERERGVGGTRYTIPEFDTTALILITTDIAMAERVEAAVATIRPQAVRMAIEQAELKLAWTTEINQRLATDGHYLVQEKERKARETNGGPLPTDQVDLLNKAAENIKAARENLEREDYANAWSEARRASRPLRILMHGLWQNAVTELEKANTPPEDIANEEAIKTKRVKPKGPRRIVPPVASAPLVAFNMLPQHYVWVDWMRNGNFGKNLVPSGSFDDPDVLEASGWANQSYSYEGITSKVNAWANGADTNARMIKMTVEPSQRGAIDGLPPFLDFPAAAIRSPAVKVSAGQFLRISVFVRRPNPTAAGAGGVIVRDSIGGELLQFVSNAAIPGLTKIVLYRRADADGDLTVTLGLAGYGEAYFDDLAVERVESAPAFEPAEVARLPRPSRPTVAPATAAGDATGKRSTR